MRADVGIGPYEVVCKKAFNYNFHATRSDTYEITNR